VAPRVAPARWRVPPQFMFAALRVHPSMPPWPVLAASAVDLLCLAAAWPAAMHSREHNRNRERTGPSFPVINMTWVPDGKQSLSEMHDPIEMSEHLPSSRLPTTCSFFVLPDLLSFALLVDVHGCWSSVLAFRVLRLFSPLLPGSNVRKKFYVQSCLNSPKLHYAPFILYLSGWRPGRVECGTVVILRAGS